MLLFVIVMEYGLFSLVPFFGCLTFSEFFPFFDWDKMAKASDAGSLITELTLIRNKVCTETRTLVENVVSIGRNGDFDQILQLIFSFQDSILVLSRDYLSVLPADLIRLIIGYLTTDDWVKLSLSAKRFRSILNADFWKRIAFDQYQKVSVIGSPHTLEWVLQIIPGLTWNQIARAESYAYQSLRLSTRELTLDVTDEWVEYHRKNSKIRKKIWKDKRFCQYDENGCGFATLEKGIRAEGKFDHFVLESGDYHLL